MTWLMLYVADVTTKYLRGVDGRTGCERLYGNRTYEDTLEFGDPILDKLPRAKDINVAIEARWSPGTLAREEMGFNRPHGRDPYR